MDIVGKKSEHRKEMQSNKKKKIKLFMKNLIIRQREILRLLQRTNE